MVKDTSLVGVIGISELYEPARSRQRHVQAVRSVDRRSPSCTSPSSSYIDILVRLIERQAPSKLARARGLLSTRRRNGRSTRWVRHGARRRRRHHFPHDDPNQSRRNAMKEDTVREPNTRAPPRSRTDRRPGGGDLGRRRPAGLSGHGRAEPPCGVVGRAVGLGPRRDHRTRRVAASG